MLEILKSAPSLTATILKKKKFLKNFFFQNFMVSSRFMLFPTLKKKIGVQKKFGGGGGAVEHFFFVEKQFFLISRFMLFSTLKKNIEKCPFTYWLNGRWFLQIVDGDSWNLYPLYPLFPCSDFVSQMWGGLGGGCNVFLAFYAISNISRKKILDYKPIISHLMFSSWFFLCWNY